MPAILRPIVWRRGVAIELHTVFVHKPPRAPVQILDKDARGSAQFAHSSHASHFLINTMYICVYGQHEEYPLLPFVWRKLCGHSSRNVRNRRLPRLRTCHRNRQAFVIAVGEILLRSLCINVCMFDCMCLGGLYYITPDQINCEYVRVHSFPMMM